MLADDTLGSEVPIKDKEADLRELTLQPQIYIQAQIFKDQVVLQPFHRCTIGGSPGKLFGSKQESHNFRLGKGNNCGLCTGEQAAFHKGGLGGSNGYTPTVCCGALQLLLGQHSFIQPTGKL